MRPTPTHVLHVVVKLGRILLVAVDAQEELAGQGQNLPVAVVGLGGQQGGRPWGPQVQRAAVVQGLGAPQRRGPCPWRGPRPGPAILGFLVRAAAAPALTREQRLSLPTLAPALEAGCAAQAVPAGAPAAPGTVGAPGGAGRASEARLRGGAGMSRSHPSQVAPSTLASGHLAHGPFPAKRDRHGHPQVTFVHGSSPLMSFPGGSGGKESVCNAGDLGLIPGLGRSLAGRRKWLPTPVFLPEESHGHRRLVGYSLWGQKESDTTEQLTCMCKLNRASPLRSRLPCWGAASSTELSVRCLWCTVSWRHHQPVSERRVGLACQLEDQRVGESHQWARDQLQTRHPQMRPSG